GWKSLWIPKRLAACFGFIRMRGRFAPCIGYLLPTSPGRKKCFEMGEADGNGATDISAGIGCDVSACGAGDRLFRRRSSGTSVGDPPGQGSCGSARGFLGGDDLPPASEGSAG